MSLEFLFIAVVLRHPDKSYAECATIAAAELPGVLEALQRAMPGVSTQTAANESGE